MIGVFVSYSRLLEDTRIIIIFLYKNNKDKLSSLDDAALGQTFISQAKYVSNTHLGLYTNHISI